jgi:hypothetical protein
MARSKPANVPRAKCAGAFSAETQEWEASWMSAGGTTT